MNGEFANPVFVCGVDRSGTTLLGSILGASSSYTCVPEATFTRAALRAAARCDPEMRSRQSVEAAVRAIAADWRLTTWNIHGDSWSERALSTAESVGDVYRSLVSEYEANEGIAVAAQHGWIDHTPDSFRYGDCLLSILPSAKFIHIVRDPRGVVASLLPLTWGPSSALRGAEMWTRKLGYGLAAERHLGRDRVLRIRYEDLLMATEETMKCIEDFLSVEVGLPTEERVEFRVPEYTRHQHRLVGGGLDPSRVDGWRKVLTPRDVELIEYVVGDLMGYLGYVPVYGMQAAPPDLKERLSAHVKEIMVTGGANRVRSKMRVVRQLARSRKAK